MIKKFLIIGAIILGVVGIYVSGVYTYFQKTQVQEALPTPSGTAAPGMKTMLQGSFGKIDAIHQGSGTAKIIEVGDKRYLRFENFQVTNGPDLYVYLAQGTAPTNDTVSLGKYFDLGRLKGNIGDQNYEIPEDAGGFATAVIWCKKFGVVFSYAVMK